MRHAGPASRTRGSAGRARRSRPCLRPRSPKRSPRSRVSAFTEGALVEAIILAGGQATRLGEAARGHPKALVPIAGHPLAEYQVSQLVRAGVDRVIVSCAAGQAAL